VSDESGRVELVVWALVLSWSPQPAPALAIASRRPRTGVDASVMGATPSLFSSDSWAPVVAAIVSRPFSDWILLIYVFIFHLIAHLEPATATCEGFYDDMILWF
jgi:hypothetical protein